MRIWLGSSKQIADTWVVPPTRLLGWRLRRPAPTMFTRSHLRHLDPSDVLLLGLLEGRKEGDTGGEVRRLQGR